MERSHRGSFRVPKTGVPFGWLRIEESLTNIGCGGMGAFPSSRLRVVLYEPVRELQKLYYDPGLAQFKQFRRYSSSHSSSEELLARIAAPEQVRGTADPH